MVRTGKNFKVPNMLPSNFYLFFVGSTKLSEKLWYFDSRELNNRDHRPWIG